MKNDTGLRHTFDTEARLYNKVRPRYPEALFDTLIEVCKLTQRAKLLEIGPGTGQATEPFAKRGYDIIAIELGAALAEAARHELKAYPRVEIITGAFEEIDLPPQAFDLVYAATAFHWINPEIRFTKPYQLLKTDGHLAIIHTNHVSDQQGDIFFHATQPIYENYSLSKNNEKPFLPQPKDIDPIEIDTKLFRLVHFQRFPMVIKYSAQEYVQLLNTYSPTLAMAKEKRKAFLNELETLINDKFEGSIPKHFVMSLTIAETLP